MDEELLGLMADNAQAEERVQIPEKTNTEDVSATEDVELAGDDVDYDRTPWDERDHTEDVEPSKQTDETETESETNTDTETETKTNTSEEEATDTQAETDSTEDSTIDWAKGLPQAPAELDLPKPEFDEEGSLTNMTGQQFLDYTTAYSAYQNRVDNYNNAVLTKAMETAETILPEIKTDDQINALFQNQVVAITGSGEGSGQAIVEAALALKKLTGNAEQKGARNAKTHIEIQKNATVDTPSNKSQNTKPDKEAAIAKRLRTGDKSAQDDLFSLWLEEGKL